MVATNRRKLLLGGLTSAVLAATGGSGVAAGAPAKKSTELEYHDLWRKLWEDHITWTRVVIIAILDKLAGTDAYIGRLLQNYEDMEDALAPYGDAAEVLGDLINDHLVIAAELLVAARDGPPAAFDDAKARWYENADQIAVQMNAMNPRFWHLDETREMWVDHLDATLDEAVDHLTGDFTGEVEAYDLVHDMALAMADFISDGVSHQFPQNFRGHPV